MGITAASVLMAEPWRATARAVLTWMGQGKQERWTGDSIYALLCVAVSHIAGEHADNIVALQFTPLLNEF